MKRLLLFSFSLLFLFASVSFASIDYNDLIFVHKQSDDDAVISIDGIHFSISYPHMFLYTDYSSFRKSGFDPDFLSIFGLDFETGILLRH